MFIPIAFSGFISIFYFKDPSSLFLFEGGGGALFCYWGRWRGRRINIFLLLLWLVWIKSKLGLSNASAEKKKLRDFQATITTHARIESVGHVPDGLLRKERGFTNIKG